MNKRVDGSVRRKLNVLNAFYTLTPVEPTLAPAGPCWTCGTLLDLRDLAGPCQRRIKSILYTITPLPRSDDSPPIADNHVSIDAVDTSDNAYHAVNTEDIAFETVGDNLTTGNPRI